MHERILKILEMCLKAKEKGHDCFFTYYPHADQITVSIHLDGWKENSKADIEVDMHTNTIFFDERKFQKIEYLLHELIGSDSDDPGQQ